MNKYVLGAVLTVTVGYSAAAMACASGVALAASGTVTDNVQRIFVSLHDNTTEMVIQVAVPATVLDYAAIIPVHAMPTLDPQAVESSAIDAFVALTNPQLMIVTAPHSGGCGGSANQSTAGNAGVVVSAPVAIGPLIAVSITGDDATAITAWLNTNGYAVPAAQQPLLAAYAAPGRYFIALKRDPASAMGAISLGVHFTLPGEYLTLPLKFTALGTTNTVSFQVFVGTGAGVGVAAPLATLTLDDVSKTIWQNSGYAAALAATIAAHTAGGFVVEGVFPATAFDTATLQTGFFQSSQTITRMSAIFNASAITSDATFNALMQKNVPTSETASNEATVSLLHAAGFADSLLPWLAICSIALPTRRRKYRTTKRSL